MSAVIVYASADSQADAYMHQMLRAMEQGDFKQAVLSGTEAEREYSKSGRVTEQIKTLINLSTAYQSLGQYKKGLEGLNIALDLSKKAGDETLTASVLSRLGSFYIFINQLEKAGTNLKDALDLSVRINDFEIRASTLNYLGNLYTLQKKYTEAIAAYKESAVLSERTNNHLLSARAMANMARALVKSGKYKDAEAALASAYEKHVALVNSHEKTFGLINIGQSYRQLNSVSSAPGLVSLATKAFKEALAVAEMINDHLSASYALGYLGQVEEGEGSGNYSDAMYHTRRAIFEAQQVNAPEAMYLWQWQSGRLFKAEGKTEEAVSAYRNAVNILQSIRYELLADCKIYNQSSFQDSVEPLYFGLAALLLRRADSIQDEATKQSYFREVRQTIELLKTAELQDYFQDACVVAGQVKMKTLDSIASNAAVIYVIPLPDRLELLLGLEKGIERFTVRVDADTFTNEVRLFRKRLEKRTTRQYLPHSQRLYDWIIRPLESELASHNIDTLIFVPYGPLYTIPMAALHDGKGFLVERFALASTPGLSLTDPQHIQREKIKVLLAGLTESVQGFPALINVPMELAALQELYTNTLLKDNDFRIPLMQKEMENVPYSIVHIASHGEFFDNSRDTYLLTWDEKLSMDQLEKFMGIGKFRKEPVALLTLSACVSAAGNDRAALGLAGVAIKAGARSAVATLWYINDHTSYELVTEFYRQLKDAALSNAKALQKAQIKLLGDRNFRHPGYWSPFLLIGNWL